MKPSATLNYSYTGLAFITPACLSPATLLAGELSLLSRCAPGPPSAPGTTPTPPHCALGTGFRRNCWGMTDPKYRLIPHTVLLIPEDQNCTSLEKQGRSSFRGNQQTSHWQISHEVLSVYFSTAQVIAQSKACRCQTATTGTHCYTCRYCWRAQEGTIYD